MPLSAGALGGQRWFIPGSWSCRLWAPWHGCWQMSVDTLLMAEPCLQPPLFTLEIREAPRNPSSSCVPNPQIRILSFNEGERYNITIAASGRLRRENYISDHHSWEWSFQIWLNWQGTEQKTARWQGLDLYAASRSIPASGLLDWFHFRGLNIGRY